jgi:DNA polymerase bacteriophage-type
MHWVYLDFETRGLLNLKAVGTDRYMTSAQPIMAQWAVGDGPVRLWDMLAQPRQPKDFTDAVYSPQAIFVAHNAVFDRAVMERLLLIHTDASRWVCTRAQAYAHNLPGSLEFLGQVLDIGADVSKAKDGQRLIKLFCVPQKDGTFRRPEDYPDDWEAFKNYGMRDIDALRAIHRRLPSHNFTGANLRYFWLNSRVNERGFAIDVPLAESAVGLLDRTKRRSDSEVADATGGAVSAVTQRDRLLQYFLRSGLALPNLRKSEVEAALQRDDISPEQRFLLEARLEGAKASGAKYKKALTQHVDGRIRYTMQYAGAGTTGRTAHMGFQPGNMPRSKARAENIDELTLPFIRSGAPVGAAEQLAVGGPNTACADALRHTIVAPPGRELAVADFSNIESRVLAWIAGEQWKLDAYCAADRGEGADLYRLLYSRFFGAALADVTDFQRQSGKVTELACGFGGSVGALVTMAAGYGIDLDALVPILLPAASDKMKAKALQVWKRAFLANEDYDLEPATFQACHVLVQLYRAANANIDAMKRELGRAVEGAIRRRGTLYEVGKCKVWAESNVLIIQLPSSRRLYYWNPALETKDETDPETGEKEARVGVVYFRPRGKRMHKERAWPGLFLENIVQGIANDCLRYAELDLDEAYPDSIVLDVHDEVDCEVPVGTLPLSEMKRIMCKGWSWSRGLPLAASGWTGVRYGKR